ncbi:putative DNA-binding ribbon-helix-helix protein [Rubricella aquisinus]|uniref:Putative DNA-binding ribbon-helix-helix protein n=1 Tax=Rubricella aquisinus TaxID=2028108 RepID=A0A840WKU3_9RHOB|nr:ribbon-helix-helix domain-containing protein [Rubricella aquisinus]MBB5515679.1 putative DNA-binding ribbon-helix-helix protein [Rubricella aquisinus]
MRPEKHSVTLNGHRTSISLEPEFWVAFRQIAKAQNIPINALVSQIDTARDADTGLASAIRVFVLKELQARGASAT